MNSPEGKMDIPEQNESQVNVNQRRPLLESLHEPWQLIWAISLSTPLVDIETGIKLLAGTALVHTVVAGAIKLTELAYNVQRDIHHPHK